MRYFLASFFLVFVQNIYAKEVFTLEKISEHLTLENPYVYSSVADEHVQKQSQTYHLGAFDTKLSAKYDKKDYPISEAEFLDVTLEKPIENGMEFLVGYRDAEGTQEYNNIKTGKEGEVRVGVKLPVVSVLNNMSSRKRNLKSANLEYVKLTHSSKNNLRKLYFEVYKKYYEVIYFNDVLKLEEELLRRSQKREKFILARVKNGSLAQLASLEAKQQIINREQRVVLAQNSYANILVDFLRYINLDEESFNALYTLPLIKEFEIKNISLQEALLQALDKRADLRAYDYELKKLTLDGEYANLLKYPKLDVGLYGVHDFEYESGFKLTFDMAFPIERREYDGKHLENLAKIKKITNEKNKLVIAIKTNLSKSVNSLENIQKNMQNSLVEVELVEKLQDAQEKKYKLGLSDLFMLNQREIYTLDVKKKLLKYRLDCLLLSKEIEREIGDTMMFNSIDKEI